MFQLLMDNNYLIGFDEMIGHRIESQATTYAFLFNYRGVTTFLDLVWDDPETSVNWGVSHADELTYLFPIVKSMISSHSWTNMIRGCEST